MQHIPVTELKGAGPALAEKLAKLGIDSVQDLLFHFPLHFQDRTRLSAIASLRDGDEALVRGEVELAEVVFAGRRALRVRISDGSGFLDLRFFTFSAAQHKRLSRGVRLRAYGRVRRGRGGLEMIHPEYQFEGAGDADPGADTGEGLTPVYPSTGGVHQYQWRTLLDQALGLAQRPEYRPPEVLPAGLLSGHAYPDLLHAILDLHRPPVGQSATLEQRRRAATERLALEELLAHHLSLRLRRQRARRRQAPVISPPPGLLPEFEDKLPFQLTRGQRAALEDIVGDLATGQPMQRLVQGDVGCGKTLVAIMAALVVARAGHQVAVMAPTEILAEQHLQGFSETLAGSGLRVGLLTGSLKGGARRELLTALQAGELDILLGTHALFQDDVLFRSLALVIIDEQHRFGVHQRLALRNKGALPGEQEPHQLVMTATPIPRTLAMTFYADLDCSIIDTLPPGRKPVETVVIPDGRRTEVVARVADLCRQGRQVYWVCPLISESEALQCQAAEETLALLQSLLPDLYIGLVHGRLGNSDKEAVMQQFKAGAIQLLVATTVIEVGVNVPNACLMVIENAERMGLSQLHQLRGRVGRGSEASVCILMYQAPLSRRARQRLAIMRDSNDGFRISQVDLDMRGPGEMFGTRQTGELQFRVADLQRDQYLLPQVQSLASDMLKNHADLVPPLIKRWQSWRGVYSDV